MGSAGHRGDADRLGCGLFRAGTQGAPLWNRHPRLAPTTSAPAFTPTPGATASSAGPTAAPTAVLPAAPAEMAVPFELPNAAGGTVSLDSFLGDRHVVLVFYRTYR